MRAFLRQLLQLNGYSVSTLLKPAVLNQRITKSPPDLILIDSALFRQSTENACKEVKKYHPSIKIIIMGKRGSKCNADDYLSKPFTPEVLLAKIKSKLQENTTTKELLTYDDVQLDHNNYVAIRDKKEIKLTPKEYALLRYLMTNTDKVLSREMILNQVWTYAPNTETRVVDIFISFLRNKIDKGHKRKYIHSIRGFGYKFS